MTVNILFAFVCIVVIVVAFTARGRKERATKHSREHVLDALAPVISGSLSDNGELIGTYSGHPVETSLRTTGRVDHTVTSHSGSSNIEVILLVIRGVSGSQPWSFYTSVSAGPPRQRWRSAIAFAGVLGQMLSRLTPFPIDPGTDERLRQGGLPEALERLVPPGVKGPYLLVSFVPDGAQAIGKTLQRVEAIGGAIAEKARRDAAEWLRREQGGHLRIEVERAGTGDPTPERFRETLDAAIAIAKLNATINVQAT